MQDNTKRDNTEPFYANGLRFTCKRCSECCRIDPGFVFLSTDDKRNLAEHLQIKENEFEKVYCRTVDFDGNIKKISLKEKSNYDCIFWRDGCTVYEARPLSCKTYPFWESMLVSKKRWEELSAYCPGCGQGELHSREYIEKCAGLPSLNE